MLPNAWGCFRCLCLSVWCNVRKDLTCRVFYDSRLQIHLRCCPAAAPSSTKGLIETALLPALMIFPSLSGSPCSFHPQVSCVWPNEITHLVCSLSSSPDVFTLNYCLLLFGSGYHDAHLWSSAVILEVHDTLAFSLYVLLFSPFYFILLNWKLSVK